MTIFLYQFKVIPSLNTGCGTEVWIERTRLTKNSETFAVDCISWQKLLVTPPAMEKGGSGISDFPPMASLMRHVPVQSTSRKHPLSLLRKDPYYIKII